MLLFFFLVMPRLRHMDVRKPMILGFLALIVSQVMLISVPAKNEPLLLVATTLEACSVPAASTLLDKLVVLAVDAQERARTMAILYTIVVVLNSPFGWIAGRLSEVNRNLPFVLNIVLFSAAGLLTFLAIRLAKGMATGESATGMATQA